MQNSVFECNLDASQFVMIKSKLINEINENEDSLRFYILGNKWEGKVEHIGIKPSINFEDTLII